MPLPGPLGHEFSGVVAKRGRGLRRFPPGTEVMAVHTAPCRACQLCRQGLYNLCPELPRTMALGAFAQFILLPAHVVRENVFVKPPHLGFQEAAFLEPLSCVLHGMRLVRPRRGQTALVMGAGPIGLLHLLVLRGLGLRVALTALEPQRLRLARRLGAEVVFTPGQEARLWARYPQGLRYVFECTGQARAWQKAPEYAQKGGTVVLFGGLGKGAKVQFLAETIHYHELTLRGSFHFSPQDVREARRLLLEGRIDVRPLISGRYGLQQTEHCLRRLKQGRGIKYVLEP
jgi:L-iditol 2-dehydrogenase